MKLTYGALDLTDYPYAIQFGMSVGAPQNVSEALAFLLQDGEVELSTRASNRTLQFNVLIEGADLAEMAEAEAALILETEKSMNLLTIDPEDSGPASVYETFRAQVALARDDDGEVSRLRLYSVTVNAYPFARSATEVVTAALATSGTTTTLVDSGSSTTGWSGSINGASTAPSVVSGAVQISTPSATGTTTLILTRVGSIDTSVTKYLMIDWGGYGRSLRAIADGVELSQIAEAPVGGYFRTWFNVPASSIATLQLISVTTPTDWWAQAATARWLAIDAINRTDVTPGIGTARQLLRSVDVAGSGRAAATVKLEHETQALGDAIVYFFPDDDDVAAYSPPMRQYRVAGGATVAADSSLVSGSVDSLSGATSTFDIPVTTLSTGLYTFPVRVRTSGTVVGTPVITWSFQTRVNGVALGTAVTGSRALTPSTTWSNIALARVVLPTVSTGDSGFVRVTIQGSGLSSGQIEFDEGWLFSAAGQLTMVACGTTFPPSAGGSSNRLTLSPATTVRPRPDVLIGFAADGSDASHPVGKLSAWQPPQVSPGRTRVLTVTSGVNNAALTIRHYPRWHTNASS